MTSTKKRTENKANLLLQALTIPQLKAMLLPRQFSETIASLEELAPMVCPAIRGKIEAVLNEQPLMRGLTLPHIDHETSPCSRPLDAHQPSKKDIT